MIGALAVAVAASAAPNQRAVGSGAATTGGAEPCHFSDEAGLRLCLGRGGAYAIADAAFTLDPLDQRIHVAQNTTLDGRGLLTIAPSLFGLEINAANVVIRNTRFVGPGPRRTLHPEQNPHSDCLNPRIPEDVFGCAVAIHIQGDGRNLWIDHNEFSRFDQGAVTIYDTGGRFPVGHPDMITVSNNIFRDSFFAGGTGVYERANPMPPEGHVTFYGNLFDHVYRRAPKVAGLYFVHVFNNYYVSWGGDTYPGEHAYGCNHGFGPMVTAGGELLLENNVAEAGACAELVDNQSYDSAAGVHLGYGKVRAVGNLALDGAEIVGGDALSVAPSYTYTLLPADQVKAAVLANAGIAGNH